MQGKPNSIFTRLRESLRPRNLLRLPGTPYSGSKLPIDATHQEVDNARPDSCVFETSSERCHPVPSANAAIEDLPPELRQQIAYLLDFDSLGSLVRASPVFHAQYVANRKSFLTNFLTTALGDSVVVDALAVQRSGSDETLAARTKDNIMIVIGRYRCCRYYFSNPPSIMPEYTDFTLDEAAGMVGFHKSVMEPLLDKFVSWMLAHLPHNPIFDSEMGELIILSRTERTRILRAMYRFQIACNLFGGLPTSQMSQYQGFEAEEIFENYLFAFDPWEIEEILCVLAFMEAEIGAILDRVSSKVDQNHPVYAQLYPQTLRGGFDVQLDSPWHHLVLGTAARGLRLLHTLLNAKDFEHLVATTQRGMVTHLVGSFIHSHQGGATCAAVQEAFDLRFESEKQVKQEASVPMPFGGDEHPDGPPCAWTIIWGGTYSNMVGEHIPEGFRRWGYVMWDEESLTKMGVRDAVVAQGELWHDDFHDPRR